ncbi:MAG: ScyD/ScyE family protein [Chloroflexia bacterium]|nr:ScyD/ScyE family protein [Chloroflexia bacterium]
MTDQSHTSHQAAPGATPDAAATPEIPAEAITVVATGLAAPRGFTWGPDGAIYVALAGDGLSPAPAAGESSAPARPEAPPSVVRIEEDGQVTPVVSGLPSTADAYGDVQGPVDVGFIGDQLYVLQDATGGIEAVGLDWPNGLYAVEPDGALRMASSETVYITVNPAANIYHLVQLGEPFAMVPEGDSFWVVDANQGLLLKVLPDGTQSVIADLSLGHPVPTAIALAPGGGVYVGSLGPGPHTDGQQKVVKVTPDGEVSDYWTGLTMVTGLAVDTDGTLYALDMSTGNTDAPPNIYPNTGRVVRQTGPSTLEVVASGLNYPISMKIGPDGALYISLPAIAPQGELGSIVRIDPHASDTTVAVPDGFLTNASQPYASEGRS